MKTDREKLTDIAYKWILDPSPVEGDSIVDMAENIADYFISKGVTIPVRCAHCVCYDDELSADGVGRCRLHDYAVFRSDFCSYGERKEE